MPEIVQEIGAYAGLASVLGLAVLSALYFSQARDVKRLREWAGRAPERAEQGPPVPGRVVAQPQPKPAQPRPAAPALPGEAPVAAAAAGGARPAAATPAAATPAAATTAATPAAATAQASTAAPPKPGVPVPAGVAAGAATKPGGPPSVGPPRPGSPSTPAAQRPGAAPPVPAAAAAGRPGGPSRPSPSQTAIIPPPRKEPWYRRLTANPRYVVLVVAGVLILGGAAAFGVSQLTKEDTGTGAGQSDDGGAGNAQADNDDEGGGSAGGAKQGKGGAIKPSSVTVAFLNGTTVPGLAATIGDQAADKGFQVGTVANFSEQQLAESVVQYTVGHEREALVVGRRLGISQRQAATPESQELAGDATVIVIAGADKAP